MMAPIANVRRALCALQMEWPLAEVALATSLVALDVLARVTPHAPNFTPVAASALFAGTVLRGRALALSVPLAAMLISDLVLGCPDWRIMAVVYAALALPALLGRWGRTRGAIVLALLAVSSSLIFFATTNFAVWAFSGMYTHDLAGLVHCYIAALPFLHNTLLGDMFWTTLLFASWWSARALLAPRLAAGGVHSLAWRG
jgi:Family of unknown function (DUF6580)